ncbi:helix-turn-helix domain-containing protein [Roseateles sp. NT4]|uniref:helix-turn-helix domain-containing protein n=1 Tax=Roseateles sp. NT4 TaxID=3453715 RepID=UPI003EE91DE6
MAHNKNETMEPISEGPASQATTAGAWLRSARQQRGLHIAALAVMLKVPQAKLEALEADRFDQLPDATFARALATAMCRALKVDPAPVLALLPRTRDREFDVRPGLNQPFRERSAGPIDGGVLALLLKPVVWGPVLLLVAAAAVYWIPAGWLPERDSTASSSASSGTVVAAAASAPVVEFVPAPAASEPVVTVPAVAPVSLPVASAPLQVRDVAPPPAALPASAPAVKATVTAATGSALRLTATADTWVEVTDAQGQMLLSRVLRSGEQQEFTGAAPYKVRVGNVRGTRIEWRGGAIDLAALAKDNVARLELK